MANYRILRSGDSPVMMEIKFKDKEGENVGRSESFFFTQREFARWLDENEERWDAFEERYDVSLYFGGVIYDVEYIMGIYG